MNKGLISAKELAFYISNYYQEKFGENISPIKLQKSLYFCFAYWGSYVRNSKNPESEIKINRSEYLFDENIEAWVYGPVVADVYHESDLSQFKNENLFNDMLDVKKFIDGLLDEILKVSDFKLVEVSHSDKCWINNFDPNSDRHNVIINKEDIINEYITIF